MINRFTIRTIDITNIWIRIHTKNLFFLFLLCLHIGYGIEISFNISLIELIGIAINVEKF